MSTIAPPPPPSVPPPAVPGAPVVTVPNPPPALQSATINARLEAQVMAQLGKGTFQLNTPLGTLTVQSPQILPPNATLSFFVKTLIPQVKLQITSINGQPVGQESLRPVSQGAPPPTPTPLPPAATPARSAATGQPNITMTAGTQTIATVLRPPIGNLGALAPTTTAPSIGSAGAPMPSGAATPTQPNAQPQQIQSPQPTGATTQPRAPSSTPAPPSAQTAQQSSTQQTQTASFPRQGVQIPVRITSVQPPVPNTPVVPPPAATSSLTPGTSLQGVVTQAPPTGGTVVATPVGDLMLPLRSNLPPGSRISLQTTGPATQGASTAQSSTSAATLIRDGDWPALRDAMQALARTSPDVARHLATQVIPRPDGQMAAGIMFFISVLRGGDVRSWLGDTASRVLDKSRGDIMSRLGDDFSGMARLADSPQTGDWRSFLIPFLSGQEIDPIRLNIRKDDNDDDEEKNSGTRFLVDVTLTKFGRIQLDGLVKAREKHMDMIVRSDRPFPASMRTGIQTIFSNAADVTGMKGGLSFQAEPPQFIDVIARDPATEQTGVLV